MLPLRASEGTPAARNPVGQYGDAGRGTGEAEGEATSKHARSRSVW